MSQLVFIMCWNPDKEGFNAREGKDLLGRVLESRQKKNKLTPHCPIYRLPAEGVVQIKGEIFPSQKIWIKGGSSHHKDPD